MYQFTVPSILEKGGAKMKKRVTTITATSDTKSDAPSMLVTTADRDRDNDRLQPEGVDLAGFKKNPVLLWGHDYSQIPIGKIEHIDVEPGRGIRARWRWLEGDDQASRVRNAWRQGIISAASVGFRPKQTEPNEFGGRDYLAWELLEVSLVAVPANPFATRALKTLGLLEDGDLTLEITDFTNTGGFVKSDFRAADQETFDIDTGMLNRMVAKQLREQLRPVLSIACKPGVRRVFGSWGDYIEVEGWNPPRGR